jgi:hypothetical protein
MSWKERFRKFVHSHRGFVFSSIFILFASFADAAATNLGFHVLTNDYGLELEDALPAEQNPFMRNVIRDYGFEGVYLLKLLIPFASALIAKRYILMRYLNFVNGVPYLLAAIYASVQIAAL